MLLDFSYSDIPWDTFLLTAFRTSGCKFWMNCHSVSCSMPVFVTHLHYKTFSLLITGNSYDNISRVGFINDFDLEATFEKIIYYFRYWSRLLLFSYSDIWNLSYPNFKVSQKDFALSIFVTGDNIQTSLGIRLLLSGVSSKRYQFLYKWIQWFQIWNTCLILLPQFQLSNRCVLKLNLQVLPFGWIEKVFCRNIAWFEITTLLRLSITCGL